MRGNLPGAICLRPSAPLIPLLAQQADVLRLSGSGKAVVRRRRNGCRVVRRAWGATGRRQVLGCFQARQRGEAMEPSAPSRGEAAEMSSRDCKRSARLRPPPPTAAMMGAKRTIDTITELPDAAQGPPSRSAEALLRADEAAALLQRQRSRGASERIFPRMPIKKYCMGVHEKYQRYAGVTQLKKGENPQASLIYGIEGLDFELRIVKKVALSYVLSPQFPIAFVSCPLSQK